MQIGRELRFGSWMAVIAMAGTGLVLVAPAPWGPIIGWALIIVAAAGALGLTYSQICEWMGPRWRPACSRKTIVVTSVAVCVAVFLSTTAFYFWPNAEIEWADEPFGPIVNGSRATASGPMQFQVDGWDFKGKNLTTRTLHQVHASVEVERTKATVPLHFFSGGQLVPTEGTNGIPPGAAFNIGCMTRKELPRCEPYHQEMTPDSFLEEVGPFTFMFQYEGQTVRKYFSFDDVRHYLDGQKKRNDQASPAQTPQVQQAPVSDQQWAPISASQAATLTARLKLQSPGRVMVACASVYCRDLADSLAASIHDAGWDMRLHHGGGLGVDGVVGIELDQDTPLAVALQEAVEGTTGLKVALHPLPAGYPAPAEITLVVGTKPF